MVLPTVSKFLQHHTPHTQNMRRGRGRGGAYYREKYGGRGRGRGGGRRGGGRSFGGPIKRTAEGLRNALFRLENQQYGAYKSLVGTYSFNIDSLPFTLSIDRVQSDAYAPPSTMHVELSLSDLGLDDTFFISSHTRRVALCDWLTRRFAQTCKDSGVDQSIQGDRKGSWKSAKGGDLRMYVVLK